MSGPMVYSTSILKKGADARFHQIYGEMIKRPHLMDIAAITTSVNSNSRAEDYSWLGDVPQVREWIGDKQIGSLNDYSYEIKNKDWYAGFAIDRTELEDEEISAIMPRVDSLAQAMSEHQMELVTQLMINGTSGLAYDGNAFFSNRTAPNDNLLAGTGTTLATVKADIQTARAAMMKFTSDTGKVMGLMMDTIVCPPELEATILEAVESSNIITSGEGATVNPVSRWIKRVIVSPELSDVNDWYGFSSTMPLKPFISQMRKMPETVIDDTQVKKNKKIDFSAERRGNAGYGFYQMAVKVVNT